MRPYEKLHAWYNSLGFSLDGTSLPAPPRLEPTTELPFASEDDVRQFEYRTSLSLPDDFREHLKHNYRDAAPFEEEYWIQFWPVTWLVTVPDETGSHHSKGRIEGAHEFVHFADHFIRARDWAINCGDGPRRGQVYELLGGSMEFTCESFAELIDLLVTDPYRLTSYT